MEYFAYFFRMLERMRETHCFFQWTWMTICLLQHENSGHFMWYDFTPRGSYGVVYRFNLFFDRRWFVQTLKSTCNSTLKPSVMNRSMPQTIGNLINCRRQQCFTRRSVLHTFFSRILLVVSFRFCYLLMFNLVRFLFSLSLTRAICYKPVYVCSPTYHFFSCVQPLSSRMDGSRTLFVDF